MARATLATVQRIVYDNLGITDVTTAYGTLKTNERYLAGYINDKIAEADIATIMFLLKNKQHNLLGDLYTNSGSLASGASIPNAWGIIDVIINGEVGTEISFGEYEQLNAGGIYDSAYKGYYALHDRKLYYIGVSTSAVVTYIDITHPTTLTVLLSPTGFEDAVANLASANLLMKRGDKPSQAEYYKGLYSEFMQSFLMPDSNVQDIVSD
jgi:hypothetical protein